MFLKPYLFIPLLLLLACSKEKSEQTLPMPAKLTREATGYYSQMIVIEGVGPKAQIWLTDTANPIWFSSVRDAIKFTRTPEEADNIVIIYVNPVDTKYQTIDLENWINLEDALFVINSKQMDGMGLSEAIPFAN